MKKYVLISILTIIVILFGCRQKAVAPTDLRLISASPTQFSNNQDVVVTVYGEGITSDTSFFIQSNLLTIESITATTAKVVIPSGFLPATYGIMASRPDGQRSVLYPAFTITQGEISQIDPREHPRSYVDGIVLDYETKQPIRGAIISVDGLEAQTDENGYFLLWGVPPGRVALRIEAEGYEPVYRFAEVPDGAQTVTVKLSELEPLDETVTVIGPKGGIHKAKNGAYLVVPEGALEKEVPIRFTYLRGPTTLPELAEDGYYLAFAHLEPAGLVFKKPATLYLPLPKDIVIEPGTDINIFYYDARQGRWVDDVTTGKITLIDGKYYLVYQINHFTWIGGTWYPDKVNGCVVIGTEHVPAHGVVTNFGVSNGNGEVIGSTTRSQIGRELKLVVHYQGKTYESPPVHYEGSGSVTFPECIELPLTEDIWNAYHDPMPFPQIYLDSDIDRLCSSETTFSKSVEVERYPISLQGAGDSEGLPPVYDQINGLTTYAEQKLFQTIDPSSLRVYINGNSLSDSVVANEVIEDDAGTKRKISWEFDKKYWITRSTSYTIVVQYTTRTGATFQHHATFKPITAYEVAPLLLFPVRSDEDAWLGIDSTLLDELPLVTFSHGIVTVLYEEGEPIHDLKLLLPVYATYAGIYSDEIAPVNASNVYLTYGPEKIIVSESGEMRNGVALLPIIINTDDPENYQFRVSMINYGEVVADEVGNVDPQQFAITAQGASSVLIATGTLTLDPLLVLAGMAAAFSVTELTLLHPEVADPIVRALENFSGDNYAYNDIDNLIDYMIASGDITISPIEEVDSGCWDQTNVLEYLTNTHAGEQVAYAPNIDTAEYLERCTPKPEFRSGQRPEQDHFVYDQRSPTEQRAIRNLASSAIIKRWLKEIELVCRFGAGTRTWSAPEIQAFKDAARAYRTASSHTQGVKQVLNVLRDRGLYGRNGKYTGHHINGKACHQADAGNVNNIELIERDGHMDICHGGDFRQCSSGETLKPFDEIADYLRSVSGRDDINICPTFNF